MDIAGSLTAVTAALGLVKELRSIDVQFDKAELKLKIADLTEALSEAKLGLVDVAAEMKQKDEEIARLADLLQFKAENLVSKGAFRYFADENGAAKGAPICPVCEKKGLFLKLAQDRGHGIAGITYVCPSCRANYGYGGIVL